MELMKLELKMMVT